MNASVMIQWSLLESKNRRINKTRTLIPFSLSSTVHFSLSLSSTVHFFHPSLRSFSLYRLVFSLFSLSLVLDSVSHFLPHYIYPLIHSKPSCIFSQTRKGPNFRTLSRNNSFSFIGKESNRISSAAVQILRSSRTRTRSSNGHS